MWLDNYSSFQAFFKEGFLIDGKPNLFYYLSIGSHGLISSFIVRRKHEQTASDNRNSFGN